jgi:hypothetical protein
MGLGNLLARRLSEQGQGSLAGQNRPVPLVPGGSLCLCVSVVRLCRKKIWLGCLRTRFRDEPSYI